MSNAELNVYLGRVTDGVAAAQVEAREDVSPECEKDTRPPRNRKNGFSPKTIQGDMGKLPPDVPRDRNTRSSLDQRCAPAIDRQASAANSFLCNRLRTELLPT